MYGKGCRRQDRQLPQGSCAVDLIESTTMFRAVSCSLVSLQTRTTRRVFFRAGCSPPDFSQAQVSFFVQEPWTSRVNAFLNLLDNMDPKVQRCMTDYFKGIMAGKVNECAKKHGPKDIRDFQMPPIPGGYNVDLPKMYR